MKPISKDSIAEGCDSMLKGAFLGAAVGMGIYGLGYPTKSCLGRHEGTMYVTSTINESNFCPVPLPFSSYKFPAEICPNQQNVIFEQLGYLFNCSHSDNLKCEYSITPISFILGVAAIGALVGLISNVARRYWN